jgi:hypothetical protein
MGNDQIHEIPQSVQSASTNTSSVQQQQLPVTSKVANVAIPAIQATVALESASQKTIQDLKEHQPAGTQDRFTSVKNAKQTEREIVYKALHEAAGKELRKLKITGSVEYESEALAERDVLDQLKKRNQITLSGIKATISDEIIKEKEARLGRLNKVKLSEAEKTRLKGEIESPTFEKNYAELQAQIAKIAVMCQRGYTKEEGAAEAQGEYNKEILYAIRKALENPAYKLLKEQESHPLVHFLHTLCLASYVEPKVLNAFSELGAHIKNVVPTEKKPEDATQPRSFSETLRATHDVGEAQGLNNASRVTWVFERVQQMLGAFVSTVLGRVLTLWHKPYDPRGEMGNNAGALYTEVLKSGNKEVGLRKIYTPSPTIGSAVSPEARAILQAMENRHFMTPEKLNEEPYKQVGWVYTNLQNIASLDEGERSRALMRLNEEYPFSARFSTVSVDSKFYIDGAHGSKEEIEAATKDDKGLDDNYKNKMVEVLTDNNNFKIDGRGAPDFGYYFHVPTKDAREQFIAKLKKVVSQAYDTVKKNKDNPKPEDPEKLKKWNWQQKAAFRELVNMGVTRLLRARAAAEVLENRTLNDTRVELLDTEACKECIDRGGKANALMMWALSPVDDSGKSKFEDKVLAAMHGRALLGRFRLILPSRIEPMFALTKICTHAEVRQFLLNVESEPAEIVFSPPSVSLP